MEWERIRRFRVGRISVRMVERRARGGVRRIGVDETVCGKGKERSDEQKVVSYSGGWYVRGTK